MVSLSFPLSSPPGCGVLAATAIGADSIAHPQPGSLGGGAVHDVSDLNVVSQTGTQKRPTGASDGNVRQGTAKRINALLRDLRAKQTDTF